MFRKEETIYKVKLEPQLYLEGYALLVKMLKLFQFLDLTAGLSVEKTFSYPKYKQFRLSLYCDKTFLKLFCYHFSQIKSE